MLKKAYKAIAVFWLFFISTAVFSNEWVGAPLPDFQLLNQEGESTTKGDFKGQWMVLYFYPKDDTPGCTVEANNFRKSYSKFQKMNTEIVGVSLDDVESHKEFSDAHQLPFPLLADDDKQLAKKMDMVRILPWPHTRRETFIVDPDGVIVKHYEDVDPDEHVQMVLKDLPSLQKNYQR